MCTSTVHTGNAVLGHRGSQPATVDRGTPGAQREGLPVHPGAPRSRNQKGKAIKGARYDFAVKRGLMITKFEHVHSAIAYHQAILGSVLQVRGHDNVWVSIG